VERSTGKNPHGKIGLLARRGEYID
jgi:hypothetical protein